ncbi:DUF4337 domain-containing protein [Terriglobus aquaticus]|uniref:DUF4337 domain-containing protein n=1 Tax=Terriglobus aquaticus TaxID=940139 RepID=A0ABW9KNH0_9BACT|nr:DUF4337 domain-containing protein [Terriglobus aquaticus]
MEASEISEFMEQQEKASETHMMAVSFSISVLAVLVALVTVLSHRAHTAAVLNQSRASDEWNLYQAKKIRQSNIATTISLLQVLKPGDAAAEKQIADFRQHTSKWDSDLSESEHRAHALEMQVEAEEHRASRYDAGEALLQIGVVLASITLLTRQRIYWLVALAIGLVGLGYGAAGLLAH